MSAVAWHRRALAQARFETVTALRNGEQLLVSLVLPALALAALVYSGYPQLGPARRVDVVSPGVIGLVVASTAFTAQAIQTAYDRRYGFLAHLGTTPLGRDGFLAGKALAALVITAVQALLIALVALAVGWRPVWQGVLPATIIMILAAICFVACALLLAAALRAEGVLAVANLVWVLIVGLGGLLLPVSLLPQGLATVVHALPTGATGEGLRCALIDGRWPFLEMAILAVWAAALASLAARFFRFEED